eukprot:12005576-Prorocentrum_lima.AAC.1
MSARKIPVSVLQSAGPWVVHFGSQDVDGMMQDSSTYLETCIGMVTHLTKWCMDREAKAAQQSW